MRGSRAIRTAAMHTIHQSSFWQDFWRLVDFELDHFAVTSRKLEQLGGHISVPVWPVGRKSCICIASGFSEGRPVRGGPEMRVSGFNGRLGCRKLGGGPREVAVFGKRLEVGIRMNVGGLELGQHFIYYRYSTVGFV